MSSTEASLQTMLSYLPGISSVSSTSTDAATVLMSAKRSLLSLDALLPTEKTSPTHLALARATLEAGALLAIRARDGDGFIRHWRQLQPFYELPESRYPKESLTGQKNKITGLYLMLLLTTNEIATFHAVLEGLEMEPALEAPGGKDAMHFSKGRATHQIDSINEDSLEGDAFLRYPVIMEQWLMEGAYSRAWAALESNAAPSEDFAVFNDRLANTIRSRIADCSQKSYASISISSARTLLFFDSDVAVIQFAKNRGWIVGDGRLYFHSQQENENAASEVEILGASKEVIQGTIGYVREMEGIV